MIAEARSELQKTALSKSRFPAVGNGVLDDIDPNGLVGFLADGVAKSCLHIQLADDDAGLTLSSMPSRPNAP